MIHLLAVVVRTEEGQFEDDSPGYIAAMVEAILTDDGLDATVTVSEHEPQRKLRVFKLSSSERGVEDVSIERPT